MFAKCSTAARPIGSAAPIARASPEKPRRSIPPSADIFWPPIPPCTASEDDRLGTIHVLKDFTSRRLAENKFRNLFEKAQEGVFIATPQGRLLDCNDALTRLFGYEDRAELIRTYAPEKFYRGYRRIAAAGLRGPR